MKPIPNTTGLVLRTLLVVALLSQMGCKEQSRPNDAPVKKLVVASWGGAYQEAQRKAFFEPFSRETGIEIVESSTPDYGKFYEWQAAGQASVDVADVETYFVLQAGEKGVLHQIDFHVVDTAGLIFSAINDFGVATVAYADVITWNTERNPKWRDVSWSDFWNVEDFPGPRGLRDLPASTLEAALLGAGTSADVVYPLDIGHAFRSLNELRDQTKVALWNSGSQPIEWLLGGSVALTTAWNGRVHDAQLEGKPIAMTFENGMIDWLWWVIPKNAREPELALQFVAFTLRPDRQAELARLIPYGPTNRKALELLDHETLVELPTSPENFGKLIVRDNEWWGDHDEKVQPLWREWKLGIPKESRE